ncbi:MAG: sigmaK-factor processing regulatory BofA [Methanocalculus sp. MSAO_Arc1]|uniref:pro-sigmaK processing inhibitor BofA family protein n=1 Tax=Methanocalculus TaxID=71151 RepID=UPI000FF77837|nr:MULTISPECIES: pro-sigmaK processing inhibitor BofA family protein [unclassified Methanocalculus]MCP1661388.1 inhibitor of the pro-sigma K processing machinery [Methanocalculus sp. AMF5]RQD79945.1 MAG: sigmaK-factor processing regulatory BofA [Methanocalculus sp. MSAO_Arc1]
MLDTLLLLLLVVVLALTAYYFIKKGMTLLANAALGLIILFLVNTFEILSIFGAPDIPITWATVLICAFGGIPGAVILILLAIAGIII